MKSFVYLLIFALVPCWATAAVQTLIYPELNTQLEIEFQGQPKMMVDSPILVKASTLDTKSPVDLLNRLKVSLYMPDPDMGHFSAPTDVTPVLDGQNQPVPGSFLVSNVYFVMSGAYEIWFEVKGSDETVFKKIIEVVVDENGICRPKP